MTVSDPPGAAEHSVLFAESDDELAAVVGDLLGERLQVGDGVVVLATADHLRLLEGRIAAAGIDIDRARREGALVTRDAHAILEQITPHGSFDPTAFDEVIGTLVRSAAARGPVHAFGELVGLLWDSGRVQEVIDLESAWNRLIEETSAALVCAYPSLDVDAQTAQDLRAVCALHTAALDEAPFERTWHLPAEIATVSQARRLVIAALRARGLSGAALEDSEVTIAELVANAVLHGRSTVSITVRLDEQEVRVEVADENPQVPVLRAAGSDATSGRGLHLLTALADRWGVERTPSGKVVWTELAR